MGGGLMTMKQIRAYIDAGRENEVDPADLQMYYENMKAREHDLDFQGVKDLYGAICVRAVEDYNIAMDGTNIDRRSYESILRETDSFFDSEFFQRVSGIRNGDIVREEIRKRREESLE